MYRQFSFTLSLILALPLSANAENKAYSLSEAMGLATQNSPIVQKSEARYEEMKWKNVEGFSAFIPSLQVQANHFVLKKFQILDVPMNGQMLSIPQIYPTSSATAQVNWLLFDGFSNVNNFRATQALKTAAEADFQWAQFQLQENVKLQYSKVVAAKKLEDVGEQNLKTLQNHLEQVKAMKKGGLATNYDLLRVEAQLSEAQAELLQLQDNIQITQEKLGQILGLNEAADAKDTELELPNPEPIKKLNFNHETKNRKDLEALSNSVEAADLKDSAGGTYWIPKLGFSAQYILYNNLTDSITDYDRYRKAWNAGLFLTWDLFAPASFARSKQEKYQYIQNQKSLVQANLQAPVDFAFWKKRYIYSATLYEAKKADLERAQETLRLANAGFKAGVRTTTELLDAELDLFRARAGIVNSQVNCTEAKTQLELATGETL